MPPRRACAALLLGACARSAAAPEVAGRYDTQVSVDSATAGCELPVQRNPTTIELADSGRVVLLRHAGTTYGGALREDGRFTTEPTIVRVGELDYRIAITGRLADGRLDARTTIDYGQDPACHVVVRWSGPRQADS